MLLGFLVVSPLQAQQQSASIRGTVELQDGGPVANAIVFVVELGRSVRTDHDGRFEVRDVTPGTYRVLAQREGLSSRRQVVTVADGEDAVVAFSLEVTSVSEEITVTASAGGEASTFDTFNAVRSLDSIELAKDMAGSLGEVLADEPGVAKRSFGPGSSRPIIRGFDGDRVLILADGVRTGDLSSQSGDHGVTIDPGSVNRVEVVKGPATLLYGSNAVGGVVNTISTQDALRSSPHQGLGLNFTADGGTANGQLGGNGAVTWTDGSVGVWVGGGSRSSDDYETPAGIVENSGTELSNGRAGVGYFGDEGYLSVAYTVEDGRIGIPLVSELVDEGDEPFEVDLDQQRQSVRIEGGLDDLSSSVAESFKVVLNYLSWQHSELEIEDGVEEVGTRFDNETWIFRGEVEQRRTGLLHGKVGAWGQFRDFVSTGEEALAPPTAQRSIAAFAYEELDFAGWRLQFGARVENNDYEPERRDAEEGGGEGGFSVPEARPRSFTGVSASVGAHVDLPRDFAVVANLSRSYRAPALTELYNFGPHVGNLTFEVGNPDLEAETTVGVELSLRHQSERVSARFNAYWYGIEQFVFPAFTGDVVEGLQVAEFLQADSRHAGFDASGSFRLHRYLWLHLGASLVDAELTGTGESLPRIPPAQGTIGVEIPYRGLVVEPEVVLAADQEEIFRNETRTGGYAIYNVGGSYTLLLGEFAHIFSVKGYNLGDRLYRNHTSFIKDFAPEIGRGVKFSYALRFF